MKKIDSKNQSIDQWAVGWFPLTSGSIKFNIKTNNSSQSFIDKFTEK